MRYLKLWFLFCRQSIKRDLLYRIDFVLGCVYWMLNLGIAWVTIKLFFAHTYHINGWTQSMMFSLLGLGMVVMGIAGILLDRNVYEFRLLIQRGEFDRLLTYPISSFFTSMFRYVAVLNILGVIVGLAVFGISIGGCPYDPQAMLWFLLLTTCSVILLVLMQTIIATIGFWAVEPSLNDLLERLAGTFATYPIRIFSRSMQVLLTWFVPMAFLTTIPLETLYGTSPAWYLVPAVFFVFVLGLLLRWVWRLGVRGYSSASS